MGQTLAVPGYLPAIAHPVVPFARRHTQAVAARYQQSVEDCWDEVVSALLRATVSYNDTAGKFGPYAQVAIHRALAKACHLGQRRRTLPRPMVPLEDYAEQVRTTRGGLADTRARGDAANHVPPELTSPSAEDECLAYDAVCARVPPDDMPYPRGVPAVSRET